MKSLAIKWYFFVLVGTVGLLGHFSAKSQDQLEEICTMLYELDLDDDQNKIDSLRVLSQQIFERNPLEYNLSPLYKCWGWFYLERFMYDSAIFRFKKRIDYALTRQDSVEVANAYYSLAVAYTDIYDFVRSVELFQESIQIFELMDREDDLADIYNAIANNYYYSGDANFAIGYYQKAIQIFRKNADKEEGLSMALSNMAAMYMELKEWDEAEKHYNEAVEIITGKGNLQILGDAYQGLGVIMLEKNRFIEAKNYFLNSLSISYSSGDKLQAGFGYHGMSEYYLKLGKPDSSIWYANKALDIAKMAENAILRQDVLKTLHFAQREAGLYKEAYESLLAYKTESDSIFNIDKTRRLNALQIQYEINKKEEEITKQRQLLAENQAKLERQSLLRDALFAFLSGVLVIMALVIRNQSIQRKANRLLQAKNDEIAKQKDHIELMEKTKSRWFINISHELKTPLTLVKGPVDQLIASNKLSSDEQKKLNMASRNLKTLGQLIHEILDLSSYESGQIKLNKSSFDLAQLVKETAESFESAASMNEIKMGFHTPLSKAIWVFADEQKLKKLVSNLISNAIKFTQVGGKVDITITENSESILVKVADNGKGISEKDKPYIFNRFYQANDPAYHSAGSGIGLSICKEIAQLHNGQITVESKIGEGATFELRLPVKLKDNAIIIDDKYPIQDPLIGSGIDKNLSSGHKRILLVDDHPDMRDFIEGILSSSYVIHQVMNGKEAIKFLEKFSIDLIISDLMMPKMDGYQFSKSIKSNPKWADIPMIIITAAGNNSGHQELIQIGIDDIMHKPFDQNELLARVHFLLENKHHRNLYRETDHHHEDEKNSDWLKKLIETLPSEIRKTDLNTSDLAKMSGVPESKMERLLQMHVGMTVAAFIREARLQYAFKLIQSRQITSTKELADAVGINHPGYFSVLFEKRFGKKVQELIKS